MNFKNEYKDRTREREREKERERGRKKKGRRAINRKRRNECCLWCMVKGKKVKHLGDSLDESRGGAGT